MIKTIGPAMERRRRGTTTGLDISHLIGRRWRAGLRNRRHPRARRRKRHRRDMVFGRCRVLKDLYESDHDQNQWPGTFEVGAIYSEIIEQEQDSERHQDHRSSDMSCATASTPASPIVLVCFHAQSPKRFQRLANNHTPIAIKMTGHKRCTQWNSKRPKLSSRKSTPRTMSTKAPIGARLLALLQVKSCGGAVAFPAVVIERAVVVLMPAANMRSKPKGSGTGWPSSMACAVL